MIERSDVSTPEIGVIKRLIKEKSIEIVPIDVNENPFDRRLEAMFKLIKQEMPEYLGASQMLSNEAFLKGFPFLNSEGGDIICRDLELMEKYFINKNKEKYEGLLNFYFHWLQWNDKRENQWIDLINKYLETNNPRKVVFLVGSAHRHRLIDKFKNIHNNNEHSSDWDFFYFE